MIPMKMFIGVIFVNVNLPPLSNSATLFSIDKVSYGGMIFSL